MKRICSLLLTLALVLGLCACGSKAPAWQEQYDLGVKYLSEGNYQEAILAFTAAIEIDPKRAEAYVGRGDAYTGTADLSAAEELTAEQRGACESALADYLEAIGLDRLLAAAYGKVADLYLALGDRDAAAAILEQGYDATGDESLLTRAKDLREDKPDGASETVTLEGYVFDNGDVYETEWNAYMDQYQNQENGIYCSIDGFGVRFSQPAAVTVDGQQVSIAEACFITEDDSFDSALYNFETETAGPLMNHDLRLSGYFYLNDQTEELTGPVTYEGDDSIYYEYRPNGDYVFCMTGYEEIS